MYMHRIHELERQRQERTLQKALIKGVVVVTSFVLLGTIGLTILGASLGEASVMLPSALAMNN